LLRAFPLPSLTGFFPCPTAAVTSIPQPTSLPSPPTVSRLPNDLTNYLPTLLRNTLAFQIEKYHHFDRSRPQRRRNRITLYWLFASGVQPIQPSQGPQRA
jgi:hypothetical protein